jgi:uncharacterized protein with NRDE domain
MCLIFISVQQHPVYKLIVAANRDEFYHRKTAAASFWEDQPEILGGRDLEAGGTWLAMTRQGRLSMVTNFRDPKNIDPKAPSRGQLVTDALLFPGNTESYLKKVETRAHEYNGFNLLAGTADELFYFSNYSKGVRKLSGGTYGLSNHLLDTPWPKLTKGKEKFRKILANEVITPEQLFSMLSDDQMAPDELLPDTGIGLERERVLSSMFIKSPGYGTRCSTVILVDRQNRVTFTERVYDLTTFQYSEQIFTFVIG